MTPRERVLKALAHEETDKVPKDFTASREIIEGLCAHFGIEGGNADGPWSGGISTPLVSTPDHRLLEALGVELRMVAPLFAGPPVERAVDGSWTNLFGVRRVPVPCKGGTYFTYAGEPLRGAGAEEVDAYPWPDPDWFDYSSLAEQCRFYEGYAIVAGYPGNVDFLNKAATLVGAEALFIGIARSDPALLRIFDRLSDFFYEYNRRTFEAGAGMIDIAFFGDDYGGQSGPLIGAHHYHSIFRPRWERHVRLARDHGLRVMQHSCGSVGRLLPEMIEAGVEILDVVQPGLPDMDLADLKARFGKGLAFHGALDIQGALPGLAPDAIRAEVRRVIDVMSEGGGFILAPTNKITPETPIENVLAAYEAAAGS